MEARTEAEWLEWKRQKFMGSRWYREGRTFEWWLKRRQKLRRIGKQQETAARRRR